MLVGTWHYRLPPLPGELLTSCLARNALAHGTSPMRFMSLFWPDEQPWAVDLDRDLSGLMRRAKGWAGGDWPDLLAEAMGLPREVVLGATLDAFRTRLAGGDPRERGNTPLLLSAGLAARKRRLHGLQFCPDCLGEGIPHFRREWRLAFTICCPRHGRPLRDGCPWCDATVAPHRTMTRRLTDCHECARSLTRDNLTAPSDVPMAVATLQDALMGHLERLGRAPVGPWADRAAFDGIRCLIGVAANRRLFPILRRQLGLPPAPLPPDVRLCFEMLRTDARTALLETAVLWLEDWPLRFLAVAGEAGVTRRTFARSRIPAALAAQVGLLPGGNRRDNSWKPILEEPVLKRLRRKDPARYRAVRAERIIEVVGRAEFWDPRAYPEHVRAAATPPIKHGAARPMMGPQESSANTDGETTERARTHASAHG